MGMFDTIECEHPLPDGTSPDGIQFQTKDLDCTMDRYTITAQGFLMHHKTRWEPVPEHKRPNWGTPRWDTPLGKMQGSMKVIPMGDEVLDFTGDLNFYDSNMSRGGPEGLSTPDNGIARDLDYVATFKNGRLLEIKGGESEPYSPQLTREAHARIWDIKEKLKERDSD